MSASGASLGHAEDRQQARVSAPLEELWRAAAWDLLARLLLAPPDAALLDALASQSDQPAPLIDSDLDSAWRTLGEAAHALPDDLVAEEYAALFDGVGTPLLDPYASRYVTGFLMDQPLGALRADLTQLRPARARPPRACHRRPPRCARRDDARADRRRTAAPRAAAAGDAARVFRPPRRAVDRRLSG